MYIRFVSTQPQLAIDQPLDMIVVKPIEGGDAHKPGRKVSEIAADGSGIDDDHPIIIDTLAVPIPIIITTGNNLQTYLHLAVTASLLYFILYIVQSCTTLVYI